MNAPMPDAVLVALRAAHVSQTIASARELSGGCIHRVIELILDDGRTVVAKINRASMLELFQEEAHDLAALAETGTVIVPQALATVGHQDHAVLLMTGIAPQRATEAAWRNFGRDLAALHAKPIGERYGWHRDSHLGSSPQPNSWQDDWVEFNAINRLGFQLEMARQNNLLEPAEAIAVEHVIARLETFIPRRPKPSLLHGDLWSGNALPTTTTCGSETRATVAVIDPACSIGDGLADIAMMQLFGGFPAVCFLEYEEAAELRLADEAHRAAISVYQLYHLLNHLNLFGRTYAPRALAVAWDLHENGS
jgi:protein-ribulosamine 3-kinase